VSNFEHTSELQSAIKNPRLFRTPKTEKT